jgi:hypothetical protein
MASRLDDAHAVLYAALEPVLPGRVDPYPPPAGRVVAPKIWIGEDEGNPATIGSATTVTVVRFAVWVVYDGAVHAQIAGLRGLVSAVVDAVEGAERFYHDGWRPAALTGVPLESTLRATVITATNTITARTLCPPAPTTATIPPVPIGA